MSIIERLLSVYSFIGPIFHIADGGMKIFSCLIMVSARPIVVENDERLTAHRGKVSKDFKYSSSPSSSRSIEAASPKVMMTTDKYIPRSSFQDTHRAAVDEKTCSLDEWGYTARRMVYGIATQ